MPPHPREVDEPLRLQTVRKEHETPYLNVQKNLLETSACANRARRLPERKLASGATPFAAAIIILSDPARKRTVFTFSSIHTGRRTPSQWTARWICWSRPNSKTKVHRGRDDQIAAQDGCGTICSYPGLPTFRRIVTPKNRRARAQAAFLPAFASRLTPARSTSVTKRYPSPPSDADDFQNEKLEPELRFFVRGRRMTKGKVLATEPQLDYDQNGNSAPRRAERPRV